MKYEHGAVDYNLRQMRNRSLHLTQYNNRKPKRYLSVKPKKAKAMSAGEPDYQREVPRRSDMNHVQVIRNLGDRSRRLIQASC